MKTANPIKTAVFICVLRQIMFDNLKTNNMYMFATGSQEVGGNLPWPCCSHFYSDLCLHFDTDRQAWYAKVQTKPCFLVQEESIKDNPTESDWGERISLRNEIREHFGSFENDVWFYLNQWPITFAMWSTAYNTNQGEMNGEYLAWFANLWFVSTGRSISINSESEYEASSDFKWTFYV